MKKRTIILAYLLTAGILLGNSMPAFATEQASSFEISDNNEKQKYIITGFKELQKTFYEWEQKVSLEEVLDALPRTLSVWLEGEKEAEIPVSWKCKDDYEGTEYGIYEFMPFWDEESYSLSGSLNKSVDVPYIEVSVPIQMTEGEISFIKEAQSALEEIVKQENISALIYLCEEYSLKETPDLKGNTVISLATGTTVQIQEVSVDENRTVWYRVCAVFEGRSYEGYVERSYLAYSNEAFIEWEQSYLSAYTMQMASFSLSSSYADVEQFPESYQSKLLALKKAHPNWIFVKQNTGLNWQTVINNEKSMGKSLISSSMGSAYKNGEYGQGWHYASEAAVKYYMDPRNFLDDTRIFQFEQLTFNPSYHTKNAVQNILGGTFMSGEVPGEDMTYAQAFYEIGASLGVSPFHLASRVYQEQGKGTSSLISGKYSGYEGYYNYFNVEASGKTNKEIIVSGLTYAKKENWNTRYKSLKGGAKILAANYILKGQDTLYLQKFNVDGRYHSLYTHQYMQNIMAPYTESSKIKAAYAGTGAIDNAFVFKIPVYKDMPSVSCPLPGTESTAKPTPTTGGNSWLPPAEVPTEDPGAGKEDKTGVMILVPTEKPTKTPTAKPKTTPSAKPATTPAQGEFVLVPTTEPQK